MRKLLIVGFAICATLLAILLLVRAPLGAWTVALVEWVRRFGVRGGLLYALIYVISTVILFPQTPLNLGAGFLYGTLWGSVIVSIAGTIAATIAFLLARYVARDFVARRLAKYGRFESMDRAVEKNGLKLVLLMRLQPVFIPFAYLNIGLGLTRVRLLDYVLGTFLGTLPGTILVAYLGSATKELSSRVFNALPSEGISPGWFFWIGLAAMIAFTLLVAQIARQSFASTVKQQTELREAAD